MTTTQLSLLSEDELTRLENKVREGLKSFVEVGNALLRIQQNKGYALRGYKTFESYCLKEFGFTDRHGRRMIAAAQTADAVQKAIGQAPANESTARELKGVANDPVVLQKVQARLEKKKTDIAHAPAIVIGAVDNASARILINEEVKRAKGKLWWLDAGNDNHSGQVLLGNWRGKIKPALGFVDALPAPSAIYPDLIKTPRRSTPHARRSTAPSCAELTAAGEQGLMVNRMAAAHALAMLDSFLGGTLAYFGVAFDLAQGGVRVWSLDAETLK